MARHPRTFRRGFSFLRRPIRSTRRPISERIRGLRAQAEGRRTRDRNARIHFGALRGSAQLGGRLTSVAEAQRSRRKERLSAVQEAREAQPLRGEPGFVPRPRARAMQPTVRREPVVRKTPEQTEREVALAKSKKEFEERKIGELTERRKKDIIRRYGSLEQYRETVGRIGTAVRSEQKVIQGQAGEVGGVKFSRYIGRFKPLHTFGARFHRDSSGQVRGVSGVALAQSILTQLKSKNKSDRQVAQNLVKAMGSRMIPGRITGFKKGGKAYLDILKEQVRLAGEQQRIGAEVGGIKREEELGTGVRFRNGGAFQESEEFRTFQEQFASHDINQGAGAFGTHTGTDLLNLEEGQTVEQGDDGQFQVVGGDQDLEADERIRSEERLEIERQQGIEDIEERFRTPLGQLRGETLIGGQISKQQRKRIARLERRKRRATERLETQVSQRKEDILLQEQAQQQRILERIRTAQKPEAVERRRLTEERLAGMNGIIREFADKGETISLLKAKNIWLDRQKFNKDTTPKFSETAEVLDETVLTPQFDKSRAYETAVSNFDDNVLSAEKYLKSRGFLDSEIAEQKELFQKNVLGFTQEQIDESKESGSIDVIFDRMLAGQELSWQEVQKVLTFEKNFGSLAKIKALEKSGVSKLDAMRQVSEQLKSTKKAKKKVGAPEREADLSTFGKEALNNPELTSQNVIDNEDPAGNKLGLTAKDKRILFGIIRERETEGIFVGGKLLSPGSPEFEREMKKRGRKTKEAAPAGGELETSISDIFD